MSHTHLVAALLTVPLFCCAAASAQSFFPPTLQTTSVTCSSVSPGMTVTVNVAGVAPAFYRPGSATLTHDGLRLRLTYADGCGLLTVITNWNLSASLSNLQPGTYPIDAYALADGVTCPFVPLGPTQIGTVLVPPLPCAFRCLGDVAGLGGTVGPDGQLTVDDVVGFLAAFFAGNLSVADVASLGGGVGPDGTITPDDLVLFLARFFAGCP